MEHPQNVGRVGGHDHNVVDVHRRHRNGIGFQMDFLKVAEGAVRRRGNDGGTGHFATKAFHDPGDDAGSIHGFADIPVARIHVFAYGIRHLPAQGTFRQGGVRRRYHHDPRTQMFFGRSCKQHTDTRVAPDHVVAYGAPAFQIREVEPELFRCRRLRHGFRIGTRRHP